MSHERFDTIIRLGDVVDLMTRRAAFVSPGKAQLAFETSYQADKARYRAAMAELSDAELKDFVAYYKATHTDTKEA